MLTRLSKASSLFLGVLMFLFGFLKFFQPFHGWFEIQIQQSHLPHERKHYGPGMPTLSHTVERFWPTLICRGGCNSEPL